MLLADRRADLPDGGADDRRRLVGEDVLAIGTTRPVDRVLERAGDRAVVLGGSRRAPRRPPRSPPERSGDGRIVFVIVPAVEGELRIGDLPELQVGRRETDERPSELPVDRLLRETADEIPHAVRAHWIFPRSGVSECGARGGCAPLQSNRSRRARRAPRRGQPDGDVAPIQRPAPADARHAPTARDAMSTGLRRSGGTPPIRSSGDPKPTTRERVPMATHQTGAPTPTIPMTLPSPGPAETDRPPNHSLTRGHIARYLRRNHGRRVRRLQSPSASSPADIDDHPQEVTAPIHPS